MNRRNVNALLAKNLADGWKDHLSANSALKAASTIEREYIPRVLAFYRGLAA